MSFKVDLIYDEYNKYYYNMINNIIKLGIDCSGSLCFSDISGQSFNKITVFEVSKILNCVVKDIEYKDAYSDRYTWVSPCYVLFEKNGFQLELRPITKYYTDKDGLVFVDKEEIKWRIIKVKNNKKCKHTSKLDVHSPKIIRRN